MTKWRSDLIEPDPVPQTFFDALQEFIGTYVSENFSVVLVDPTTLRVPAGTDNAQVGIGINGKWRYNRADADAAAPAGLTVGDNPIFVAASANSFGPNINPPPTELDSTDYSFRLIVLPSGSTPTGGGSQALYRQVGTVTWDGSRFTAIKLTVGIAATPSYLADVVAREGLATQTLIGSVGGVSGIALGSAGDVSAVRDTTGGTNLKVNVPVNATGFRVGGTALAASHLSNGVVGSGAVVLAASPALSGTPTAPTAAVGTSTTQLATTAFVIGQAAVAAPPMDGAAAPGTSTRYARADHVHPIDTSRAPLASPVLTGTPTAPTPPTGDNTTQVATTAYVQAQSYVTAVTAPVRSVAGKTGVVALAAADVTSAADKSAATAQVFGSQVTAVGLESLVAAGAVAFQIVQPGDAAAHWFIDGAGSMEWGLGGSSSPDIGLQHAGSGNLQIYSPAGGAAVLDIGSGASYGELRPGGSVGLYIGAAPTEKLGFFGATPVVQPTAIFQTAGFLAGAGASVLNGSTWTGGVGATAYTLGDIVRALKLLGALAA